MKRLLVVYNHSISKEDFTSKNQHLLDLAKKYNIEVDLKSNAEIYIFLNVNKVKSFYGNFNYDCCLFFDHDPYLAKNLELLGLKVINSANAHLLCENKANMYQELIKNNISIPKTILLPELGEYSSEGIKKFVDEAINELSLPLVIKMWYGATGEGVYLVKNREDVYAVIDKFKGQNILLQEFVVESAGTDIRLFVAKDKVVTAVRRQSGDGTFRSNSSLGGSVSLYIPTIVEQKLATMAVKAMNCDFGVVDILKSVTGSLVLEVNATANFAKLYEVTKVDVYDELLKLCFKIKKKAK